MIGHRAGPVPPAVSSTVRAVIRPIGVESLPALADIMARAFDPRFGEAWNKAQCLAVLGLPGYAMLGAWAGAAGATCPPAGISGFAITRTICGESELLLIAVDPDSRGAGVGRALINHWLAQCNDTGVERAFLEMREDNDARYLYESCGFSDLARRRDYYRGNDGVLRDAVTMETVLTR
ncbi:MAG: GNAT family N-acetyltransferase [Sphingopyxis sp.]